METSPQLMTATATLEQRLKGSDRVFTIGDAAAITGVAMDSAKQVLDRLMQKYDCRLQVTENGDLIYDFGKNLHRRGERTWAEWQHMVRQWLWQVFVFLFKIWITITLVVYFVIFLLILLVIILAAMSNNNNDSNSSSSSSSSNSGGLFSFLMDIFRSIFIWNTHTRHYHYETDARGYTYREYDARPSTLRRGKGKGFVASVYDFVFGPERVEFTRTDHQKEVAAFVRQNKGIIVLPEVIGLGGWRREPAQDFLSEVIVKYQGDAAISPNSVLYGDFYTLNRQQADTKGEVPIVWYWDEYEPEYKLTGNTWWRNLSIVGMNCFNLVFATVFVVGAFNNEIPDDAAMLASVVLGWIPFVFSALFFGIPIARSFQLQTLRHRRNLENIRKRVMRAIYKNADIEISLDALMQLINETHSKGEAKLDRKEVEYMMQELIKDLDGEINITDNAKITYRFTNLREEMNEANRLRADRDSGKNLGKVVLDTHD